VKPKMIEIILLLLFSNIITLTISILRANFVDTVNFSPRNLLDTIFWIKNPALFLILSLYAVWFFALYIFLTEGQKVVIS